jgi:GNAT superfamily N-acetyltransferase
MRGFPEGIEARRAGEDDLSRLHQFVLLGIDAYRAWAPHWRPSPPPPEARERLERVARDDKLSWILIAEAGDEMVGVISLSVSTGADARPPEPGTVYLWQMFVRSDWQGTGLAGALMDRGFEEARRRGYTRITLWAAAGAAQARRFYEREGFTLTGEGDTGERFGLPLIQYEREI